MAIKLIRKEDLDKNEPLKEVTMNGLHVIQELYHPNICKIIDLLVDDKFYYIVMELLEGGELFDIFVKKLNNQ